MNKGIALLNHGLLMPVNARRGDRKGHSDARGIALRLQSGPVEKNETQLAVSSGCSFLGSSTAVAATNSAAASADECVERHLSNLRLDS